MAKATKRAMAMATATRVASNNKGDGDGNKGGGRATATRAMVAAMPVVGEDKGGSNSNEVSGQQRV